MANADNQNDDEPINTKDDATGVSSDAAPDPILSNQDSDEIHGRDVTHNATDELKMNKAPLALLYLNVLIIATCGLIYELLAGTLASYVLGDSITQFSLIIGVYL